MSERNIPQATIWYAVVISGWNTFPCIFIMRTFILYPCGLVTVSNTRYLIHRNPNLVSSKLAHFDEAAKVVDTCVQVHDINRRLSLLHIPRYQLVLWFGNRYVAVSDQAFLRC